MDIYRITRIGQRTEKWLWMDVQNIVAQQKSFCARGRSEWVDKYKGLSLLQIDIGKGHPVSMFDVPLRQREWHREIGWPLNYAQNKFAQLENSELCQTL